MPKLTNRTRARLKSDPEFKRAWYKKQYQAKKRYWARHPEARRREKRNAHLKTRYGMNQVQYEALFEAQRGCCAICRTKAARILDIDHDHQTGEVRGLLCKDCNIGIGRFKDQPERLESAIRYLRFGLTV